MLFVTILRYHKTKYYCLDKDASDESMQSETQKPTKVIATPSPMPSRSHLLLMALLDQLCSFYESDVAKKERLYNGDLNL